MAAAYVVIERVFSEFLHTFCPGRLPLLLGLSGGPDSMALFHLLLKVNYPFEVAHIDHGWRPESGQEADILDKICRANGIKFYLKRLQHVSQRNREDEARKARLNFFNEIVEKERLSGVTLAHQADDAAETVLKRLFEGASLPKLKGLTPRSVIKGLVIYRPLLKIKKRDLIKWLDGNSIDYFQDSTNLDPHFLRGRMRETLMPLLSTHFGKQITPNLCRLGEAAAELNEFLEELMQPYLSRVRKSEEEISLDFAYDPPHSLFLWKAVIRNLFEGQQIALSSAVLETILNHLQKGSCHKVLNVGGQVICMHRKQLTIQRNTK